MIIVENLRVSFQDKPVLSGLNLTFSTGITCLMAPSGTGKTTLLNAIAGLVPFMGSVRAGKISYLFQEDRLLPWLTAKENILLPEHDAAAADRLMALFDVVSFADKKPQELSGGMKRRAALVRCLARDAENFLLDEPFRGLDEENARTVKAVLKELGQTKTVVLVTHDERDAADLGARIVTLS